MGRQSKPYHCLLEYEHRANLLVIVHKQLSAKKNSDRCVFETCLVIEYELFAFVRVLVICSYGGNTGGWMILGSNPTECYHVLCMVSSYMRYDVCRQ